MTESAMSTCVSRLQYHDQCWMIASVMTMSVMTIPVMTASVMNDCCTSDGNISDDHINDDYISNSDESDDYICCPTLITPPNRWSNLERRVKPAPAFRPFFKF